MSGNADLPREPHMGAAQARYDIVIRNGTVLDGTGAEPVAADIGIVDDRITAIGDLSGAHAGRVIDAAGRRVAPGFIDIHTHSDISVTYNPLMESIVSQGVTTQVVGNCSLCIGLATPSERFEGEQRWLKAHRRKIAWDTLDGHLRHVQEQGVATNYVMLAGQGTIRKRVMGMEHRAPDAAEMLEMKNILATALDSGAWGLSTGLEYTPSGWANVDELSELTSVCADYNGFYATHLRNEGDTLLEAVSEALEIGERAGVPVQLSHHKAEGQKNWGKVHQSLALVESARQRGLDVQMDQYPYTAFQTAMSVQFLPAWANLGDNDTVLQRLMAPDSRQAILQDILTNHPDWEDPSPGAMWDNVEIAVSRADRSLQGKTVGQLAREANRNPVELVLDVILNEKNFVSAINFAISEEDIAVVMRHPLTMIGSDAVGTSPHGTLGQDNVHPRCYGTFPRVLGRYVREKGVLAEAEAVRKMTSMPADRLRLPQRGRLQVGHFADVVIYDPATVVDNATFSDAHHFASGIDWVLVNGRIVWTGAEHTGALPGHVLRRS